MNSLPNPEISGKTKAAKEIQAHLASGNIGHAAEVALENAHFWPEDTRLCLLAMKALYRASDHEAACNAADILLGKNNADAEQILAAVAVYLGAGQASKARAVIERKNLCDKNNPRMLFELGRTLSMLNPRDPAAAAALEACLALEPAHIRAATLLARYHLAVDQASRAVELLESMDQDHQTPTSLIALARAHEARNDITKALPIYTKLWREGQKSEALHRQFAGAQMRAGKYAKARKTYGALLDKRRYALPQSFAAGIRKIETSVSTEGLVKHRLDWCYDQLSVHGAAPKDRSIWEVKLAQLAAIDRLILDWVECRPEQISQISPYIDIERKSLALLADARLQKKGVFVGAAHMGIIFGGLAALHLSGFKAKALASTPYISDPEINDLLLSTTAKSEAFIGRNVMKSLRENCIVAIAIDGASNRKNSSYKIFDRPIYLSEFLPRVAYRRFIPSFFPVCWWSNSRVTVRLEPLPDRKPHEDIDGFVRRWMAAYITSIETMFLSHPEALRGSGGFWSHIYR